MGSIGHLEYRYLGIKYGIKLRWQQWSFGVNISLIQIFHVDDQSKTQWQYKYENILLNFYKIGIMFCLYFYNPMKFRAYMQ